MIRCASNIIFVLFFLATVQTSPGFEQPAAQETPFQWLATNGETSGVKYATHKIQPLSLDIKDGPPVEIEQEEVKVDAQTTRITRRVFNTSVNGERLLTGTVVEEIKKMPGERVRAVRTTSIKDLNGRLSPVQQNVQEIAPSGMDAFQVTRTRLVRGDGGGFVEEERILQTERRKGEQNVEIDRIRYVPDLNGKWSAAERRISQNTVSKDSTETNEQVYKYDINNRLTLTRQIESTERKDLKGQTHRQSESYTADLEGKLQLSGRMTMLQTPLEGDRQKTTEIIEEADSAAPNEGLKLVRKTVEDLQILSPNEMEKHLEVFEPDVNGKMRSVYNQQNTEVK
jgi:hypothetical protein